MKCRLYLVIASLVILCACKKEAASSDETKIGIKQCRSFNINGKTISCCLDSVIEDSRCPLSAECVWAGIGVTRFSVSVAGNQQSVVLATGSYAGFNNSVLFDGFRIALTSLLPQPDLNKSFRYNDYVAEVKITNP